MTEKTCGVYRITNIHSGKSYVGSSIRIEDRFRAHKASLRRGDHHAPMLQAAWFRHGEAAFAFEILECTAPSERIVREQFWIDRLKAFGFASGYNALPMAGGPAARTVSVVTKDKLRAANLGKKASEETRAKLRAARIGGTPAKGLKHTEATRTRMSEVHRGQPQPEQKRAKLSASMKGRPKSPKWRAAISAALKGRPVNDKQREHLRRLRAERAARRAQTA